MTENLVEFTSINRHGSIFDAKPPTETGLPNCFVIALTQGTRTEYRYHLYRSMRAF